MVLFIPFGRCLRIKTAESLAVREIIRNIKVELLNSTHLKYHMQNRQFRWLAYTLLVLIPISAKSQYPMPTQKKSIDNKAYKNWERLDYCGISNDGRFAWYTSSTIEAGGKITLVSTDGGLKKTVKDGGLAKFSNSSKYCVFSIRTGIGIFSLTDWKLEMIANARNFTLSTTGKEDVLIYTTDRGLVRCNLTSGRRDSLAGVSNSFIDPSGRYLIAADANSTKFIDFGSRKELVLTDASMNFAKFNSNGTDVAFTVGTDSSVIVYHYSIAKGKLTKKIDNNQLDKCCFLSAHDFEFSSSGKQLFVKVRCTTQTLSRDANMIYPNVDVWSYKDVRIQSDQLINREPEERLLARVIGLEPGDKLISLETDSTELVNKNTAHALVKSITNEAEAYYRPSQIAKYTLVNLSTGKSNKIHQHNKYGLAVVSSDSRYALWHSSLDSNYYSQEVGTDKMLNLNRLISKTGTKLNLFFEGWVSPKHAIFSDGHDLINVDVSGNESVIHLTSSFNANKFLRFHCVAAGFNDNLDPDNLLVKVLDSNNNNGFGILTIKGKGKPKFRLGKLSPVIYKWNYGFGPFKAENAERYLVIRQTAASSPNICVTNDFENFKALSEIGPEKQYNWLMAELIRWKIPDGRTLKGVLYKPENFDANKRYPVIFHYYTHSRNEELHLYKYPEPGGGDLSIPWYVSNEYIVCIPDIAAHNRTDLTQTVVSSVEECAKYLTQFPWINAEKMGLQGHSFGGYETALIVTNSNMFAAANASAGMTDIVSDYGDTRYGGKPLSVYYEVTSQTYFGVGPWERPDLYIDNSPIFKIKNISTPLLLQHCKLDENMFKQGVELFNGMRRLDKPVWMLQYDEQDHILRDDAAMDFTVRQQQFFDHYLRDKPLPIWMSRGIRAVEKGFRSGLDFEN